MPGKKEENKKKAGTQMSLPRENAENKMRMTSHQKAGLIFPVARVHKLMHEGRYADRIGKKSAIGVSAVLEYLTAEIIEMSGEICFDKEGGAISKIIRPRHICLAVKGDEEMSRAIGPDVIIPMGGVIPYVHKELENTRRRRRKRKTMDKFKDDEAEESSESSESEDETGAENEEDSDTD